MSKLFSDCALDTQMIRFDQLNLSALAQGLIALHVNAVPEIWSYLPIVDKLSPPAQHSRRLSMGLNLRKI
jgi:hypothetical protein